MKNLAQKVQPLVSIVMPVYNAAPFLEEALDSVFAQTYTNLEVIAIDDASTDNSLVILQDYQRRETRLKILRNKKNLGASATANYGVAKAKGTLVARMDADDIMPNNRIKKQVRHLLTHPSVVVVGGQVELMTIDKQPIVYKQFPLAHNEILTMSFTAMPLQQGAMMVNRSLLPKNFIWYRKGLVTSEDLDFLYRVFKYGQAENLPDIMLYYRQHGTSITQVEKPKEIFLQAFTIRQKALRTFGYTISMPALLLYIQYMVMLAIPTALVYPLYYLWRGMITLRIPRYGLAPIFQHAKTYVL